ncbi:hypothetical protein ACH5RR_037909 [Cinchona calisaya]|uniref:AP2/ERF domain-containing protein n=1 Tax=Cinchona calisaya TaxID=153742 RepID=A0ABD2YB72_9GENT
MTYRRSLAEKSRERLTGIRRTKSGKYGAVIRDRIKKKQVWLGSFKNSEEAANAIFSRRCEFNEQLKTRQAVQLQPTVCEESSRKDSAGKLREILTGIRRTKSEKYGAVISDRIEKKQVWLGSFNDAEEVANAHLSKRYEFDEQLKTGLAVQLQPTVCEESCRTDAVEKSRERFTGIRRTKSGKYGAVIRDRIKKKQVWLGSFNNAEEAANAISSKKCEFDELKARQAVQLQPTLCQESGCINMTQRGGSGEKSGERLRGAFRRPDGKYTSEVKDPIRKKRIWLGTFRTAEEASSAYLSKKREFQEQLKAKDVVQCQPTLSQEFDHGNMTYKRDLGEKSREMFGKYNSTIEEAANAYCSKQLELKDRLGVQHISCHKSELESSHESPSSVPEKEALASRSSPDLRGSESETCNANALEIIKVENKDGCIMGLFKPFPSSKGVNVRSECFIPILDNNGFLLGEFSKLDDLSICHNEDN